MTCYNEVTLQFIFIWKYFEMMLGFEYLNILYVKSFHPNVMKLIEFTKHDIGVL